MSKSPSTDELFALLYTELREIAHYKLGYERRSHTLNTTALVHEAYERLARQDGFTLQNRDQFMALAAQAMRRVLVNYARDRKAQKRQHDRVGLTRLSDAQVVEVTSDEIVALHEALEQLQLLNARQAAIVELRFFGGYQHQEIARIMAVSSATVQRDWRLARVWLNRSVRFAITD